MRLSEAQRHERLQVLGDAGGEMPSGCHCDDVHYPFTRQCPTCTEEFWSPHHPYDDHPHPCPWCGWQQEPPFVVRDH
jgi:hypothetical protein